MLNIEAHRACIGSFHAKISCNRVFRKSKQLYKEPFFGRKQKFLDFLDEQNFSPRRYFSGHQIYLMTVLLLLVILNFHFASFKFTKLIIDGVESNPGPNHNSAGIINSKCEESFNVGKCPMNHNFIVGLMESFFAICYTAKKKSCYLGI